MKQKQKPSHKIHFVAFIVASIDGRISKNKESKVKNWTSLEDWKFFQDSLVKYNVVIVGYNTYKIAETNLKKRNTIVFTSRVVKPKIIGSVVFLNPKYSNILDFLKSTKRKNVAILGGPKVYNFFLEHKMLDELYVTIEPYIFSDGGPMFSGKFREVRLSLQSVKKINKKGTLLLKYKYAN